MSKEVHALAKTKLTEASSTTVAVATTGSVLNKESKARGRASAKRQRRGANGFSRGDDDDVKYNGGGLPKHMTISSGAGSSMVEFTFGLVTHYAGGKIVGLLPLLKQFHALTMAASLDKMLGTNVNGSTFTLERYDVAVAKVPAMALALADENEKAMIRVFGFSEDLKYGTLLGTFLLQFQSRGALKALFDSSPSLKKLPPAVQAGMLLWLSYAIQVRNAEDEMAVLGIQRELIAARRMKKAEDIAELVSDSIQDAVDDEQATEGAVDRATTYAQHCGILGGESPAK